MTHFLRLGVNIDHVATIRNARGGLHPDPVQAAKIAHEAKADGITAHLREDRRHISDEDILQLKKEIALPLNLEIAATEEMLAIALYTKPNAVCIVPEKRHEVTTEGGLDIEKLIDILPYYIKSLKDASIRVSLFIEPHEAHIIKAHALGADIIELHTGKYSRLKGEACEQERALIAQGASVGKSLGLECHAGHGLRFDNVAPIAAIKDVVELNIGHFLIGEAVFCGLKDAISEMRKKMEEGRKNIL